MVERVNHPRHFQTEAGIEAIDVVERYGFGYCLGTALIKMLTVHKKATDPVIKADPIIELEQALWYVQRFEKGTFREEIKKTYPGAQYNSELVISAFQLRSSLALAVKKMLELSLDQERFPAKQTQYAQLIGGHLSHYITKLKYEKNNGVKSDA